MKHIVLKNNYKMYCFKILDKERFLKHTRLYHKTLSVGVVYETFFYGQNFCLCGDIFSTCMIDDIESKERLNSIINDMIYYKVIEVI